MESELVDAFLAARPTESPTRSELASMLERWVETACAAWPSVDVSTRDFIVYVAQRLAPDTPPSALWDLRISDVYLAFACVQGDETALAHLERSYFRRLGPIVARIEPNAADEVVSKLRQSLLIPARPGGGLARYSGRADLWTWLRISAVRSAIKARRRGARGSAVEQSVLDTLCVSDALGGRPELDHERERFTREARRALEASFEQLAPRDKNLLMQHYVDGLTTEQLGRLHGLHRVSISRRLIQARRMLLGATRERLIRRLSLTSSECDSVLRAIRSQLDITLERVLAADSTRPTEHA